MKVATATALVGGAGSVLENDTDADLPNDTLTVDPRSGIRSEPWHADPQRGRQLQLYP